MLMAVEGPYALMVQPDDILISPREVDEHFGTMVCFHSRYALGDSHNYMDKDDFLREMYLDTVGHDEAGLKRYEHMVNIVSSRFRHGPKTEEQAVDDAMLKVISEKHITLPLYLMDHSGLAMQTTSFNDPWGQRAGGMDLCFQRGCPKRVRRRKNDRRPSEKGGGSDAQRSGCL